MTTATSIIPAFAQASAEDRQALATALIAIDEQKQYFGTLMESLSEKHVPLRMRWAVMKARRAVDQLTSRESLLPVKEIPLEPLFVQAMTQHVRQTANFIRQMNVNLSIFDSSLGAAAILKGKEKNGQYGPYGLFLDLTLNPPRSVAGLNEILLKQVSMAQKLAELPDAAIRSEAELAITRARFLTASKAEQGAMLVAATKPNPQPAKTPKNSMALPL